MQNAEIEAYRKRLVGIAAKNWPGMSLDDREDAIQAVLLKIWREALTPSVLALIYHLDDHIRRIRRSKRRLISLPLSDDHTLYTLTDEAEANLRRQEMRDELLWVMARTRLSAGQRLALELRLDGWTYREIAGAMAVSEDAAYRQALAAIKRLREQWPNAQELFRLGAEVTLYRRPGQSQPWTGYSPHATPD